jgi:predicted dehydrogenase
MKNLKNSTALLIILLVVIINLQAQEPSGASIRLVIIGMTHGHTSFILGRKNKTDFNLVGVYEPDHDLALRYSKMYNFSPDLIFSDLNKMLDSVKPEAAVAFGSIFEHMMMVEACAPRGIHMMVEKPLATNEGHAKKMQALAKKYKVHLLTDFETSWYPSTAKSFQLVSDSNYIGKIRKVVIHDGHQGPKEIGCSKEFLDWLTDPVLNGGGALIDFGCYGANLMTALMKGQEPLSVTAVTRQFKPQIYPKVDDEATIIVSYPDAQAIIEASWNWPFGRKDMEIYGVSGYIINVNGNTMRLRNVEKNPERIISVTDKDILVYTDPFSYFYDVIKGKIKVATYDLYSLEINVTVVKILDAARESARTGKTVYLKK